MNHLHPVEKELQQYALDQSGADADLITHIETCAGCQADVAVYQMLFSEIKEQPSASFDFDVQELVLSKLSKKSKGLSTDDIIAGFLVIFTCSCIGIPVYIFRKMILNSFLDVPPFFIYSIIIGTALILIIKILFLYKKFLKQIHFLNIH